MKRTFSTCSVAACLCIGFAFPVPAAAPAPATQAVTTPGAVVGVPAEACLNDLRTFDSQMQADGFWTGRPGSGYIYPGSGYANPMNASPGMVGIEYQNARPGYEVRTLVASANILARYGEQQKCEEVLATTRDVYKIYVAERHDVGLICGPDLRLKQLALAQPVTDETIPLRSADLLGTDVRNMRNEDLGSVDDIVLIPQTGKIAYLVVGRGGFLGFNEKYVPVPWADFKATPGMGLLVLDASKATMDAAPQVKNHQFISSAHFEQQSQEVTTYWKAHPPVK